MMKTFFFLLVAGILFNQEEPAEPFIAGQFTSFTTDELGNIYVLNKDEIELYRTTGEFWMRNSIKTVGTIHSMDVFYSLKPMLYSQELQQLAVLDNTLSVQGDLVWLNRIGFPQISLVASSVQNHFWLYDQLDMQLIRVNKQWQRILESGRLDQLLGLSLEPTQIVEHDNWVYLNDPQNGILVFDLFGTYAKTIPITGASGLQLRNKSLFYMKEGKAYEYNTRNFTINEISIPHEDFRSIRVEEARILYLTEKGIHSLAR